VSTPELPAAGRGGRSVTDRGLDGTGQLSPSGRTCISTGRSSLIDPMACAMWARIEVNVSDFDASVAPATIGELRSRLEAMGRPWEVPGRYNDDDPLPDPPRGGEPIEPGHVEGLRAIESDDDYEAVLRSVPPSNPFLIERWRELGAIADGDSTDEGAEDDR
jgi:hypothetical protein